MSQELRLFLVVTVALLLVIYFQGRRAQLELERERLRAERERLENAREFLRHEIGKGSQPGKAPTPQPAQGPIPQPAVPEPRPRPALAPESQSPSTAAFQPGLPASQSPKSVHNDASPVTCPPPRSVPKRESSPPSRKASSPRGAKRKAQEKSFKGHPVLELWPSGRRRGRGHSFGRYKLSAVIDNLGAVQHWLRTGRLPFGAGSGRPRVELATYEGHPVLHLWSSDAEDADPVKMGRNKLQVIADNSAEVRQWVAAQAQRLEGSPGSEGE